MFVIFRIRQTFDHKIAQVVFWHGTSRRRSDFHAIFAGRCVRNVWWHYSNPIQPFRRLEQVKHTLVIVVDAVEHCWHFGLVVEQKSWKLASYFMISRTGRIILSGEQLLDKHTDTIFTWFFSIADKMFLSPSDIIVVGADKNARFTRVNTQTTSCDRIYIDY